MNTRPIRMKLLILAVIFMLAETLNARELRSPLVLQWGYGYMHYPLQRPKDYDYCGWNVDGWLAGYIRSANSAFLDKNTTKTEPLAGVFFGSPDFTGIQAFAPGSVDPTNPFLQFAVISPRIDYNEKGVFFGVTVDRAFGCDDSWHVGVRANIPFKNVKTELENCCDLVDVDEISDVCSVHDEFVLDGATGTLQEVDDSYAYRLDFLSSLFLTANSPDPDPFVVYHNPDRLFDITMNGNAVIVSDRNNNPIHVIDRDNGTVPPAPYALYQTSVNALPFLAADGSGVPNDTRARFSRNIDYTPLSTNIVNQRKLWVVPTAVDDAGTLNLSPDARQIGDVIAKSEASELAPLKIRL